MQSRAGGRSSRLVELLAAALERKFAHPETVGSLAHRMGSGRDWSLRLRKKRRNFGARCDQHALGRAKSWVSLEIRSPQFPLPFLIPALKRGESRKDFARSEPTSLPRASGSLGRLGI